MSKKTLKVIAIIVVSVLVILFMGTLGKSAIIRAYIYTGIGNCRSIPILCKLPESNIINPEINSAYIDDCLPYVFEDLAICMPKGFTVVQAEVRKVYYKKLRRFDRGNIAYVLYRKPNYFIGLFPRVAKQGVVNDYEFISRLRYANADNINNLTDAFFVVMKSIFTPDLGDQAKVKVIQFVSRGKKGFISYNLGPKGNFFDCESVDKEGNFYKVYIKDKTGDLDLSKVFAILSTVNKP